MRPGPCIAQPISQELDTRITALIDKARASALQPDGRVKWRKADVQARAREGNLRGIDHVNIRERYCRPSLSRSAAIIELLGFALDVYDLLDLELGGEKIDDAAYREEYSKSCAVVFSRCPTIKGA